MLLSNTPPKGVRTLTNKHLLSVVQFRRTLRYHKSCRLTFDNGSETWVVGDTTALTPSDSFSGFEILWEGDWSPKPVAVGSNPTEPATNGA